MGYNNNMVKVMKNSKGFTIIELIATIGIMLLMGTVIINNTVSFLSKQKDEEYLFFKKKLEDGACIYVEVALSREDRNNCKMNGCFVSVDNLIERGYIDDKLKNPTNGDLVRENEEKYKVNVRWVDNVKTCKVNGL